MPSVTEAGFDERCSFVACHWSMLIFVTAKQTDRQRTCLIYVCVITYTYIYTRYRCSVSHCTQFQYCECSCLSLSLPLYPSLIPHPLSIQPPSCPKPSLFSSPLQYQTGTNHAASRPAGHQPGCQYLYSRVSEFHVYHFSTEFCPSSHPRCTAM